MFTFVFFIYWSEQVNHWNSAFYWFLFSTVKFLHFSVRFYFYYNTEGIFFQGIDLRSSEWVNKHNFMKAFLSRSRTHWSQETWNSRSSSGLTNLNNMKKLQTSSTLSWFTFQAIKDLILFLNSFFPFSRALINFATSFSSLILFCLLWFVVHVIEKQLNDTSGDLCDCVDPTWWRLNCDSSGSDQHSDNSHNSWI